MLDDFSGARTESSRFGASLAASMLLYGSIGAGVIAASALGNRAVLEDDLVQVAFAPPPPPPPTPSPTVQVQPPQAAPVRAGRPRPRLEQPREVPTERPAESDRPLAPPADPFEPEQEGVPDGAPNGVVGVAPPPAPAPPEPEPEPSTVPPRAPVRVLEGSSPPCFDRAEMIAHFDIPDEVRSAGIARITVVVRVTVDAEGMLREVVVLRGHPLIPEQNVVRAVRATRFTPARLADGTPYASIHTIPITIAVRL